MTEARKRELLLDLIRTRPSCSYTDLEIWNLGVRGPYDAIDLYARIPVRTGNGRSRSRARQDSEILWDRIKGIVDAFEKSGGRGLYGIRATHSPDWRSYDLGAVFAHSLDEAKFLADTMIKPFLAEGARFEVKFMDFGSPETLMSTNDNALQKMRGMRDELKRVIERNSVRFAEIESLMSAVQMLTTEQLAAERAA